MASMTLGRSWIVNSWNKYSVDSVRFPTLLEFIAQIVYVFLEAQPNPWSKPWTVNSRYASWVYAMVLAPTFGEAGCVPGVVQQILLQRRYSAGTRFAIIAIIISISITSTIDMSSSITLY